MGHFENKVVWFFSKTDFFSENYYFWSLVILEYLIWNCNFIFGNICIILMIEMVLTTFNELVELYEF